MILHLRPFVRINSELNSSYYSIYIQRFILFLFKESDLYCLVMLLSAFLVCLIRTVRGSTLKIVLASLVPCWSPTCLQRFLAVRKNSLLCSRANYCCCTDVGTHPKTILICFRTLKTVYYL